MLVSLVLPSMIVIGLWTLWETRMRIVLCFALALGFVACNTPDRAYEAPGPSFYPSYEEPPAVLDAADAGARVEDRACPRSGYFGYPVHCCLAGTCDVNSTAGDIVSIGYEAELGADASVHYVVRNIDFNRERPFRSVVVEGRYTHIRITRDTSRRYRQQLAVIARPIGGAQYTHIWDSASTAPCSERRANHLRNRPAQVTDDPWICVDLTPDLQIRRLTEEETYRSLGGVPLDVIIEPSH